MSAVGIVGNLSFDRLDGGPPRGGGAPYYCGRALRALGRRGVLVAKSAERDRRTLLTPLVCLGLPVFWRAGAAGSTATFSIVYDGDARRMAVEALGDEWTPEEARGWVAQALRGIEWVHVAPLARTDFPPATLAELARGRRLSLDGQGLVRPGRTGPLVFDTDYDPAVLRAVTVLKLAEDEALAVAPGLDEGALGSLGVPEVVVTLGSRGALVLSRGVLHHVPARPARAVGDPTGAGDAFSAAYLAARAGGHAPEPAAQQAASLVADLLSGYAR
jgi:sugar/nucleoside kinase (ribokinase family)